LAIADYVLKAQVPLLPHAGTDECTQHRLNPYLVRHTPTSSQCIFPLADFAAKHLNFNRVATITEDFAFGYEQIGGFQRVFETDKGRVVRKFWPPLVTPDYTPYLAPIGQIAGIDAIVAGFAGSNPIKFMRQYADQGLTLPVLGGQAMGDDALLKSFGDEAVGLINACPYTVDYDSGMNKQFVSDIITLTNNVPGFYAADLYVHGMIAEAGLNKVNGDTTDKGALIHAMREADLPETPRGPVKFDHLGQGIGNIFIRRIEKANGKLVNVTIKTYEQVNQFWNFEENWYLKLPTYSRDNPPIQD
jgi:branched-chain amino acid transport system substrate-binding protein